MNSHLIVVSVLASCTGACPSPTPCPCTLVYNYKHLWDTSYKGTKVQQVPRLIASFINTMNIPVVYRLYLMLN